MDAEKGVGGVDLANLINSFTSLLCGFCVVAGISYLFVYYKHIFLYTLKGNKGSFCG